MKKIKISLNFETIIFILLLLFTKQIKLYVVFLLFILIHELTHVMVGLILGLKPKKITFLPVGFKMEFKEIELNKNNELKKIVVALAGPIINLIIMGISIVLDLDEIITYSNLVIALFNLMPIYPLDGGRTLKSILNIKLETKKAYKITNKVSNITIVILTGLSSIFILYVKNIKTILVLAYLWYVVIRENKKYRIVKRAYDVIENN